MDAKQVVDALGVEVEEKPAEAPKPEDFKFLTAPDAAGLPQEHPRYADPKCRLCNGKGMVRRVVVDGTVGRVFDAGKKDPDTKNPKRIVEACGCLNKGYTRTRKKFEAIVEAASKDGMPKDEAKRMALLDLGLAEGRLLEL